MRDDKRYQSMTFAIEKYTWGKDRESARADMWKDIASFLQLLTKNDYIAVVYDDDCDIIVVQYEHNEKNDAWGVANPEWITEDELWSLEHFEDIVEGNVIEEDDDAE